MCRCNLDDLTRVCVQSFSVWVHFVLHLGGVVGLRSVWTLTVVAVEANDFCLRNTLVIRTPGWQNEMLLPKTAADINIIKKYMMGEKMSEDWKNTCEIASFLLICLYSFSVRPPYFKTSPSLSGSLPESFHSYMWQLLESTDYSAVLSNNSLCKALAKLLCGF